MGQRPGIQRRFAVIAATVLAGISLAVFMAPGASGQTGPPPPPPKESPDDLFERIAQRVPQFAGAFLDRDANTFTVLVKGGDRAAGAQAANLLVNAVGPKMGYLGRPVIANADYNFPELRGWYRSVRQVLTIEGVQSTDLNERSNRLVVGVTSDEAAAAVGREIGTLGVPPEVVEIKRVEPHLPESSLKDRHRPYLGGLRIENSGGSCTLGFPAARAGVLGFVTNAHCTDAQFTVNGTIIGQPTTSVADRIGVETVDPALFSGGDCVWAGWKCRWSDSAFIRRNAGITHLPGRIARPPVAVVSDPTVPWNGTSNFRIVSEGYYPFMGEEVTKVGQKTGRTEGKVIDTCVDESIFGFTKSAYLCQVNADYISDFGDSGSPVVRVRPNGTDVDLLGINWGGNNVSESFSPFGYGIEDDLGSLNTCAVGISC